MSEEVELFISRQHRINTKINQYLNICRSKRYFQDQSFSLMSMANQIVTYEIVNIMMRFSVIILRYAFVISRDVAMCANSVGYVQRKYIQGQ
jgi:hypothetical protein